MSFGRIARAPEKLQRYAASLPPWNAEGSGFRSSSITLEGHSAIYRPTR